MENENIIQADLTSLFRETVANHLKRFGVKRTESALLSQGVHISFVRALIKSIMGREGW